MGWLNCDGIPDPKTRRFQELNGIYARLAAKGAPYGKPIGLHEPTKQALGCQFSNGVSILGRGNLTGSKACSLKTTHPSTS